MTSRPPASLIAAVTLAGLVACRASDHPGETTYALTVGTTDHGAVTLEPPGGRYARGTVVTVTATPATERATTAQGVEYVVSQWALGEWTGDLSGRGDPAQIVMDGDKTVGASFVRGTIVQLAAAAHGTCSIVPAVRDGEAVPFGTQYTVTATPDPGYVLDACFKMMYVWEPTWRYYVGESFSSPCTLITTPEDQRFKIYGDGLDRYVIGAYFVPAGRWAALQETQDVPYARPGSKQLRYDVYAPPEAHELPVVVIVHGGGWQTNTEDIMRGMARTIAGTGRYVAVSIDYRLTTDLDAPPATLQQMMEDVFGAIAHVQEHAATYGGDPARLAVTGDSAGGYMAAAVAVMADQVGSTFVPTYLPAGKTAETVRDEIRAAVRAAAPSYAGFDWAGHPELSPLRNIPDAAHGGRLLPPQHCQVGTQDTTVNPADVKAYVDALAERGQPAEYLEIAGAAHAYYDWKPEASTEATFTTVGEPALGRMIAFFDGVFY